MQNGSVIPIEELYVGARFSHPLFFDDGQHMFLASNMPLSQRFLDCLYFWGIPYVVIKSFEKDNEEIPELESVN